jgi:lipopolysaccharide/colanic/teichoic acid biosynthesis glycosyltransferase
MGGRKAEAAAVARAARRRRWERQVARDGANAGPVLPERPDEVAEESLAERYKRMAGERFEPRTVDAVLRALDVSLAGAALAVFSPAVGVISLAVRFTSGTPVLYRGKRVGRAGEVFTMYKFRTLAPDAETRLGPFYGDELTRRTELEVTSVGRLLRASQLDELPQLFNVVRGDMSLVGPRPIRPAFFEELCVQIPQYWQRLVVRPGMTGFAQMRVTREHSWAEKLAHDLEYIADRSVHLYVRVLAETAWRVLRKSLAVAAGDRSAPAAP